MLGQAYRTESTEMTDDFVDPRQGPADLLGRGWDDPVLQRLLSAWPDRPYIDDESIERAVENGRLSLFNLDLGVYLFFADEPSFMARFGVGKSGGAITVCRVVLFGQYHMEVERYRGRLFAGLDTTCGIDAWVEALGRPEWTHQIGPTVRKARWLSRGVVVDVSFTSYGECLLVSLMPELSPEALGSRSETAERHAGLLSPDGVLASLGSPLSSPDLKEAFRSVMYEAKLHEASSHGEMDFSETDGFELYGAPAKTLQLDRPINAPGATLCLSGARYRHDLDFKSIQWQGPLPFGITFDDGPDTVLAKVGRPPDSESRDEMEGFHRWTFQSHDLHVLYSLAEDHVYRVTLLGRTRDGG